MADISILGWLQQSNVINVYLS